MSRICFVGLAILYSRDSISGRQQLKAPDIPAPTCSSLMHAKEASILGQTFRVAAMVLLATFEQLASSTSVSMALSCCPCLQTRRIREFPGTTSSKSPAFSMHFLSPSPLDTPHLTATRTVGVWSSEEHDRFLDALKLFPQGPWKTITEYVGTRSVRQVQTHAQKYQEKVSRRLHGLQMGKAIRLRREHRIDHDVLALRTLISLPPRTNPTTCTGVGEEPRNSTQWTDKRDWNGTSPSSTSSSYFYDTLELGHLDEDELPTLSESLDFFIENLA